MKFAEVRHLDKIKGNFSVSDSQWYMTSGKTEQDKLPLRLVYSNVKEIAEQHQYLFETLWARAIPAEQRIKEVKDGTVRYETKILKEPSRIVEETQRLIAESKEYCISSVPDALLWAYNYVFDSFKGTMNKERKS